MMSETFPLLSSLGNMNDVNSNLAARLRRIKQNKIFVLIHSDPQPSQCDFICFIPLNLGAKSGFQYFEKSLLKKANRRV